MIRIRTTADTLTQLSRNMDKSKRVFFVRFGDNDIFQMSGYDHFGRKINGRPMGNNRTFHTPELKEAIRKSFDIKDPFYMKAVTSKWPTEYYMRNTVFDRGRQHATNHYLDSYLSFLTTETRFYNPVCFHYLSIFKPDILNEFLDRHIRPKKKMYIGWIDPANLKELGEFDYWIKTPPKDAFNSMKPKTLEEIIRYSKKVDTVISCAGQLTRAISFDLWNAHVNIHYIDFGSVVDALVGASSRGYVIRYGRRIKENLKLKNDCGCL